MSGFLVLYCYLLAPWFDFCSYPICFGCKFTCFGGKFTSFSQLNFQPKQDASQEHRESSGFTACDLTTVTSSLVAILLPGPRGGGDFPLHSASPQLPAGLSRRKCCDSAQALGHNFARTSLAALGRCSRLQEKQPSP